MLTSRALVIVWANMRKPGVIGIFILRGADWRPGALKERGGRGGDSRCGEGQPFPANKQGQGHRFGRLAESMTLAPENRAAS